MSEMRHLQLVCMPWHSLRYPSLALGILGSLVGASCPNWDVKIRYENIRWAEFLEEKTDGVLNSTLYTEIGEEKQKSAPGEWVFSSALHNQPEWRVADYKETFVHGEELFELALMAHRLAPRFIERLADEICAESPDLVGLTSTFAQNVSCLALARAIKARNPKILIVMGGANCDGVMGPALHREFPALDFVVSGEGEDALVHLLEAIDGQRAYSEVKNLAWRDVNGQGFANDQVGTTDMSNLPPPDYDSYFEQIYASTLTSLLEPMLVMETSRGCWWGAKHHCTFCGLNGNSMDYRRKSPATILAEIFELAEKHQTLDIIMADNIIAMESFENLLPILKQSKLDIRLQYEIKANLNVEQIEMLRDSRVMHVQPGIESLSSHVLKLMEKGVTGAQNVYLLRELERFNITVSWNLLAGFPGEREDDYLAMLDAFENMVHLQPPLGAARILLQRFSPFFNKPWLGFGRRVPAPCYGIIYDKSDAALDDMVYMFETDPQGIGDELLNRLNDAIDSWRLTYQSGARLAHRVENDIVRIKDARLGKTIKEYELDEPYHSTVYLALDKPSKISGLVRRLQEMEVDLGRDDLIAILTELKAKRILFEEDGWYVSLSVADQQYRIRQEHCVALSVQTIRKANEEVHA